MLKEYRAPNGGTWLYEEGEQPKDYVAVDEPKTARPKSKQTTPKNKQASPPNKGA